MTMWMYSPVSVSTVQCAVFLNRHERKGEFVLKSGSMGGVQCYAGYRIDPESRIPTHVIVVMVNNLVGSRTELRKAVETLLLDTAY